MQVIDYYCKVLGSERERKLIKRLKNFYTREYEECYIKGITIRYHVLATKTTRSNIAYVSSTIFRKVIV